MTQPAQSYGNESRTSDAQDTVAHWLGLASAYDRCSWLTESALDYRDPATLVADASDLTIPECHSDSAFALAILCTRCLATGQIERAANWARQLLQLRQNDLLAQKLLAQAQMQPVARFTGLFCPAPFENIETAPNGDVYHCCPAWLPKPIGNIHRDSAAAIWNSAAAQDVRASIHDGSYRHCSRQHCPKLSGAGLEKIATIEPPDLRRIARDQLLDLDNGPRRVILAHDRSCNLACPSCRTGLILARKEEQGALNELADRVILPLLSTAQKVRVTASGDPFGSAHFQYLLRHLDRAGNPRLRVDLQTNGLLLTSELWDRLQLEGKVDQLLVSTDAATAATYAIVRRPGNFDVLLRNLDFCAELRCRNRVLRFRLDFVVQATNYTEIPAFISMARALGCDGVKLQMVRSWGSWTPAEFARHNVGDRAHPEYTNFLSVLTRVRSEAPFAALWGMSTALADAGKVDKPTLFTELAL